MGKLRVVGVIPARLASDRLPGKVLLTLGGKAMLHHVYDAARASPLLDDLLVATDADEVRDYCARHAIPVRMTSAAHTSGTDRVREVMEHIPADVYVNIQGDEPLVEAEHLRLLIELFSRRAVSGSAADPPEEVQVSTLMTPLKHDDAGNPNVVKVVTDLRGRALYFSRSPIPFRRNADSPLHTFKHLGFYAYRREALRKFGELAPTGLEQTERLEQLRFLVHGIPIHVAETSLDTVGVDTREDWEEFARRWRERFPARASLHPRVGSDS